MISERIPDPNEDGAWQPNSGREQKRLDLALADPEGFVAQMLTKHDRQRRTRLVWMCLTGFGLLMCSALFIAVIALVPNSVLGSDKATTAWKLWQSRKLPEAEAKFREVLMEDDKNSNAWNGLGWCLCNMGRPTEAIVAFKKCLDLEPTHPAALNGVGQASIAANDLKTAEEYLLKSSDEFEKRVPEAERKANNIPAAWFGLARVYLLNEDYEKALQFADKILKYSPKMPEAVILKEQAEKKDNSRLKQELGQLESPQKLTKTQEAWSLWQQRKLSEAEAKFKEALTENAKDIGALNGLGWCLSNSGRAAEAIEAFKKCLEIEPDHLAALNGIGQSSLANGEFKTAEEYLLKASEAFEKLVPEEQRSKQNFPASWIGLIHLYMLNENYPKAQETVEKVLKYDSQSEEMKKILEQAKKKDNSEIKKLFGK